MTPTESAALLQAARVNGVGTHSTLLAASSREQAFAIQEATITGLGPIGGWKVGAKSPTAEPNCAPLPAAGLMADEVILSGPVWRLRGIELELAFRLGRDLDTGGEPLTVAELQSAFDAVMPAIEVVETRLVDWKTSSPLAQLADLQSHGALILGRPSALGTGTLETRSLDLHALDLQTTEARLQFDTALVKRTLGGNPAADVWRLLGWLAAHCARRGLPLSKGQIVTTGSCTGMQFASAGTTVRGEIDGLGPVACTFVS